MAETPSLPHELVDIDGRTVPLARFASEGIVIFCTVRAAWSTVCPEQLRRLAPHADVFHATGVQFVVLLPCCGLAEARRLRDDLSVSLSCFAYTYDPPPRGGDNGDDGGLPTSSAAAAARALGGGARSAADDVSGWRHKDDGGAVEIEVVQPFVVDADQAGHRLARPDDAAANANADATLRARDHHDDDDNEHE